MPEEKLYKLVVRNSEGVWLGALEHRTKTQINQLKRDMQLFLDILSIKKVSLRVEEHTGKDN